MIRILLRRVLRRSAAQVRYVKPVRPKAAQGLVAAVYRQAEREFGLLAPPLALHSPAPELLAASWLMLRETLVAAGSLGRPGKEAVAAAVSVGNACPYCVTVHSATLHGLVGGDDARAIADGRPGAVADPDLRGLAAWAGSTGRAAGPPYPFTGAQAPEAIGVAATFHYLNRMVSVFLADSPLPPTMPEKARPKAERMLGWFMRATAGAAPKPGTSLDLLPPAPLPEDLTWAARNRAVAEAFARAAAAIEAAGRRSVPDRVRALIGERLAGWDGRAPGLSRSWVDQAVAGLPDVERPAGRLALLTVFAAYQVDEDVVNSFRRIQHEDRALVELVAWSAMTAARRISCAYPSNVGEAVKSTTDDRRS